MKTYLVIVRDKHGTLAFYGIEGKLTDMEKVKEACLDFAYNKHYTVEKIIEFKDQFNILSMSELMVESISLRQTYANPQHQ
jgi:hypothetical protein